MAQESRTREPAKRVLAAELYEAEHFFKEGDGEYAPSYMLLPSGGKANRVLAGGTLIELEDVGSDSENWKAKISDGSGEQFLVFAGQYQPEAAAQLREIYENGGTPEYVTVVGKPRSWEPEDSDDVIVSLRPESVNVVSEETRNKWLTEAAEATIERIQRDEEEVRELLEAAGLDEDEAIETAILREGMKQATISALESASE